MTAPFAPPAPSGARPGTEALSGWPPRESPTPAWRRHRPHSSIVRPRGKPIPPSCAIAPCRQLRAHDLPASMPSGTAAHCTRNTGRRDARSIRRGRHQVSSTPIMAAPSACTPATKRSDRRITANVPTIEMVFTKLSNAPTEIKRRREIDLIGRTLDHMRMSGPGRREREDRGADIAAIFRRMTGRIE